MIRSAISLLFLSGLLAACSKADEKKPAPSAPPSIQLTITNKPPQAAVVTNNPLIERGIEVRGAGNLFITFPRSWHDELSRVREKGKVFDSVIFASPTNDNFQLMVEILNVGQTGADQLVIKDALLQSGRSELTNSLEKALDIQEFQGPQVSACYFTVTDKRYKADHPAPGDFHYLTQGYAKLGALILSFRLVSNELAPERGQMLEMIKTARFEKKQPAATPAP